MTRALPHNMILAWQNCLPTATLAGSWDGINNLKTWNLGEEAVSTVSGSGARTITATWAQDQLIDLIMVYGHNLAEDGTSIRAQLHLGASLVWDSGVTDAYVPAPLGYIPWGDTRFWGHMLGPWDRRWGVVLDGLVLANKLTITLTGATLDGEDLAVPILYAGPSWQVQANYDRGARVGRHAPAEVQGADRGVPMPDEDPDPRTWDGTLSHLTAGEVSVQLRELLAHTRRGKAPFLALPEPGTAFGIMTQTLLAFLPDVPAVTRSTSVSGEFVCELSMREWLA